MTSPTTNTWVTNSDGSVTFNGSVRFPNGTALASGAGVAIFGPNGGNTNFPAVEQGEPGQPTIITPSFVQVAYGTALPSPNPSVTVTNQGGPGIARTENWTIYVNAGAPGESGNTILGATDLEGTPSGGYMIGYDAANSRPQWQPIPVGSWYYAGSIGATSSTTVAVKPMTSVAIPPQPAAYWPEVFAYGTVVGAVDTRVDLVARLNSTTNSGGNGQECGRGPGAVGASPPPTLLIPNQLAVGSDNIVAANTAATIFLNAENQTSSANAWNTTSAAFMQVRPSFVPV